MGGRSLRSGFTTGACAAAAARGAALMLRDQRPVASVEIELPAGVTARFALHGQRWDGTRGHCFVIKDAGDDPDVTHGVEVHAQVTLDQGDGLLERDSTQKRGQPREGGPCGGGVAIEGGTGIGRVTKPGLAVAVGEWAINPVPRQMIAAAVRDVFGPAGPGLRVLLSIPDGEQRARRTLNARLGIVGGLSLLGTTGVVRPVSHRAWTDTIDVAVDVALASGCSTVVLATGRTSEAAACSALAAAGEMPEECFVMMGDHVGHALEACHRKGAPAVIVAAQFAKLVKIACGHRQTHVRSSRLDLAQLAAWARQSGLDGAFADRLECANTARAVWEEIGSTHPLVGEVAGRALARLGQWAAGVRLGLLLVGYDGQTVLAYGAGIGEGQGS